MAKKVGFGKWILLKIAYTPQFVRKCIQNAYTDMKDDPYLQILLFGIFGIATLFLSCIMMSYYVALVSSVLFGFALHGKYRYEMKRKGDC